MAYLEEDRLNLLAKYRGAEPVWVTCYSGYTYAERPEYFIYRGITHRVQQVAKQWREPGERHFLVCDEENKLFELCYNESKDEWSLIE